MASLFTINGSTKLLSAPPRNPLWPPNFQGEYIIDYGICSGVTASGTQNFNFTFTDVPVVFTFVPIFDLESSGFKSFVVNVSATTVGSFNYVKTYNGNNYANTATFLWLAIGISSGNSGYVSNGNLVNFPRAFNQADIVFDFGYNDGTGGHSGTQSFNVAFGSVNINQPSTYPIVLTSMVTGSTSPSNRSFIANVTYAGDTYFNYTKFYNGQSNSGSEPFYWLAIGPCPPQSSLYKYNGQSLFPTVPIHNGRAYRFEIGLNSDGIWNGTQNFNTAFTVAPFVYTCMYGYVGAFCFICNVLSVSTTGFTYKKYYNGTSDATTEAFFWMAIGY